MTEDEYLEYDRTHEGKREFVNGEMIDMAGASEAHSLIVTNLTIAIGSHLRRGPCRTHGSDMRVRIDETGLYAYPDLTVVCGEPQFAPTRPESLLNPSLLVEVLSPSTANYDRGAKLEHYRRRPSVRAILLVDSGRRRVNCYVRNPDDTWTLSDHEDGAVRVPHLDLTLAVDEIYEGADAAMARAAVEGPPDAAPPSEPPSR